MTYVFLEFIRVENKKTAKTLQFKWEPTSKVEILKTIEFIKPLVVEKICLLMRLLEDGMLNLLEMRKQLRIKTGIIF